MGCRGRRVKDVEVRPEEKWDYISLQDFRSSSCLKPLSYGILYILLLISISVYAIDTYTAVNLLILKRFFFVQPAIPQSISKWIFSACIILSWIILFFEWVRAVRVIKRGGVAESYLDPLAVRVQSIRTGKNGQGWRRFLVFTELTKSKKGTEYVALFTYFSFKAWIRIVFAEGPRQVINALTLYSVVKAQLVPVGKNAPAGGHSPIAQFFVNLQVLAGTNRNQAIVLGGMAWTLLLWVISAINLMIAVILYLVFLWHHIPVSDGGLAGYLNRKIDAKVKKIVAVKVQKALDKENARREAEDAAGSGGSGGKREPTVPTLGGFGSMEELVKNPASLGLDRRPSELSLPPYSSRRSSLSTLERQQQQQPVYPSDAWGTPYPLARTNTLSSTSTAASFRSATPGAPYGPHPPQNAYPALTQSPVDRRYNTEEPSQYNPPRRIMSPELSRQQTPAPTGYGRLSPTPRGGPTQYHLPRVRPSPSPGPGPGPGPTYINDSPVIDPPRRNMTAPPRGAYFPPDPTPRSNTAPPPMGGRQYEDLEMQAGVGSGRGGRRPNLPFDGAF